MSKISRPKYIDPLGDPRFRMPVPALSFRNVTARIFPLKANMSVLTTFCDQYLNMDIPGEIVHFAPALPYVYLNIINYGSASAALFEDQNMAVGSQHEIIFAVPLQRWRQENGELVFKGWAVVTPFIYVDDDVTINEGREIWGWNKVIGEVDSTIPLWLTDPRAKMRQFDLSVTDFASTYSGDSASDHILMHVDLDPPPTFAMFPPDPRDPWSVLRIGPDAIANTASFLGSALETALGVRIRGYENNRSLDALLAMGGKAAEQLSSLLPSWRGRAKNARPLFGAEADRPNVLMEAVTLKQFRQPEDQSLACYQALVSSTMGVNRLNRCGLIGDINMLRGDSSGGYTIEIHTLEAQPIVQTLGLDVAAWSDSDAGSQVATLKPVLPFWLDVDLIYSDSRTICSRAPHHVAGPNGGWLVGRNAGWVGERREPGPPPGQPLRGRTRQPTGPAPLESRPLYDAPVGEKRALYNTALSGATQPIAGPFDFDEVSHQVYPMLADPEKLREIVQKHLDDPLTDAPQAWRFEVFGSYVYMIVTVYGDKEGEAWSASDNIGSFFDREVTFVVPVKWFDHDELISTAWIEPITYSNSSRGVATDREIIGYNSMKATIESPHDIWLSPHGPDAQRQFLNLSHEIIPAMNVGAKTEVRTLIEIDAREAIPKDDVEGWRDIADAWGRNLVDELKRKTYLADSSEQSVRDAKALALEHLAYGAAFNRLVWKQYRDIEYPDKDCYQALVQATSTIKSLYDLREIERNIHIRFHRQPQHPIVDAFGLRIKATLSAGGDVVDIIQPARPFWMRVSMRENLAKVVCYRTDDAPWRVVHPWFCSAPASAGDQPLDQPFFGRTDSDRRQFGRTRVGAWLAGRWPKNLPDSPYGEQLERFPTADDVDEWLNTRLSYQSAGANLHLNIKDTATQWLRRALVNEMTWLKIFTQALGESDQRALGKLLNPEIQFDYKSFSSKCESYGEMNYQTERYSIEVLQKIIETMYIAIAHANIQPPPLPNFSGDISEKIWNLNGFQPEEFLIWSSLNNIEDNLSYSFLDNLADITDKFAIFFNASTEGIQKTGLAWAWEGFLGGQITKNSLDSTVRILGSFPVYYKLAFLLSLPLSAPTLMSKIVDYINCEQYISDTTLEDYQNLDLVKLQRVRNFIRDTGILADALEQCMLDWRCPARWRRLTVDESRVAVEQLSEVQLVIDNILSSDWQNLGDTRWTLPTGGRRPDEFIPNGQDIAMTARERALVRWQDPLTGGDSDLWIALTPDDAAQQNLRSAVPEAADAKGPAS